MACGHCDGLVLATVLSCESLRWMRFARTLLERLVRGQGGGRRGIGEYQGYYARIAAFAVVSSRPRGSVRPPQVKAVPIWQTPPFGGTVAYSVTVSFIVVLPMGARS